MNDSSFELGTFGYDVAFLKKYGEILILKNKDENAQVIVSPKYQGKVFTSTAQGLEGASFGWINYDLISSGKIEQHINAYGGEDRFWLGPEGGQYSIFFKPGTEMIFDNWYTPKEIDTEPFSLISKSDVMVSMEKQMNLENYSGTRFDLRVNRDVLLLKDTDIENLLQITLNDDISYVAYQTENKVTNTGKQIWSEQDGTLCIWILGMFTPSANATVLIPFVPGDELELGKIATTDYFGEIPEDRLKIRDNAIFFKADGKKRSKLGLSPLRAKSVAGSYDPTSKVLTIIHYNKPASVKKYINQLWEIQAEPFKGDVLNSYNDGPLDDGSQLGPFYELESSSPAAFLNPGEHITHIHRTIHFVGTQVQLNEISKRVLGVDLELIQTVFDNE